MEDERVSEVFVGLTRPAMFGIVPLDYFGLSAMATLISFFISKSFIVPIVVGLLLYALGIYWTRKDVNFMSIFRNKLKTCPPVRNRRFWGGNSYEP